MRAPKTARHNVYPRARSFDTAILPNEPRRSRSRPRRRDQRPRGRCVRPSGRRQGTLRRSGCPACSRLVLPLSSAGSTPACECALPAPLRESAKRLLAASARGGVHAASARAARAARALRLGIGLTNAARARRADRATFARPTSRVRASGWRRSQPSTDRASSPSSARPRTRACFASVPSTACRSARLGETALFVLPVDVTSECRRPVGRAASLVFRKLRDLALDRDRRTAPRTTSQPVS